MSLVLLNIVQTVLASTRRQENYESKQVCIRRNEVFYFQIVEIVVYLQNPMTSTKCTKR